MQRLGLLHLDAHRRFQPRAGAKPKPKPKPEPKPEPKPKPHQERLELQLAQCRERLVSRTEQLLTLETMEEGGEHADAQAAVSAAAAQIAQELRRVT